MNNILRVKKVLILNILMAVFCLSFAGSVNALDLNDEEGSSEEKFSDPLPGVKYSNRRFGYLPEGETSEFEFINDDGISLDSYYSARNFIDFGDHVNSSGERTVTIFDGDAGFDGGISLGCDGLDMGFEALAEFNSDDLLKYLPQYIQTELAKLALAQIYSLPLVSTVMDGLKSMQNFVAEFKQSSCNMKDIQDEANKIKNERYQECVRRGTESGKATSAVEADCADPSGLERDIKNFQKRVGEKISLGKSLDKLLADGLHSAIGASNDPEDGVMGISPGRFVSIFIPDIRAGFNGSHRTSETIPPELPVAEAFGKAQTVSENISKGIYDDIMKSIEKKGLKGYNQQVFRHVQQYKDLVMRYGSMSIYGDNDSKNQEQFSEPRIKHIKQLYELVSQFVYDDAMVKTGLNSFKVGPTQGVTGSLKQSLKEDDTDLLGMAKDMLEYGNPDYCFIKVESGDKDQYKWAKVHKSVAAIGPLMKKSGKILSVEDVNTDADAIISRIAKCKMVNDLKLTTMYDYMQEDKDLAYSYYKKVSYESAYSAMSMVIAFSEERLKSVKNNSYGIALNSCNAKGVEEMDHTAVDDDGHEKQPYKSCKQYATQNQLSDEKRDALEDSIKKMRTELALVKDEVESYEKDFDDKYRLFLARRK